MPSIENLENGACSKSNSDYLSRDVEVLVLEIKENLRLSGLKSRPAYGRQLKATRPSPYRVPSRSWGDIVCDDCVSATTRYCDRHSCLLTKRSKSSTENSDPYEMLQELLRDGGLIKEAVRRLEVGPTPKQRYLYDSDEECRTPLRALDL